MKPISVIRRTASPSYDTNTCAAIVKASARTLRAQKRIALIAHDNKKPELLQWACRNWTILSEHVLYATSTTGQLLEEEFQVPVHKLLCGPLGGDQQIGAMIAEGTIDMIIFFWDPLTALPHDSDVKALLRLGVVWNVPIACDRSTADFMLSSPLMQREYTTVEAENDFGRSRMNR